MQLCYTLMTMSNMPARVAQILEAGNNFYILSIYGLPWTGLVVNESSWMYELASPAFSQIHPALVIYVLFENRFLHSAPSGDENCILIWFCSESSLFVGKRRVILKTCGTTTPLLCLQSLVALVYKATGYDDIDDVYYSRKNFKRPDLQSNPHRHFEDEVRLLDTFFADRGMIAALNHPMRYSLLFSGGSAYCFGAMNRSCWYLYTLNPLDLPNKKACQDPDQTLEILMTDLDESVSCAIFIVFQFNLFLADYVNIYEIGVVLGCTGYPESWHRETGAGHDNWWCSIRAMWLFHERDHQRGRCSVCFSPQDIY